MVGLNVSLYICVVACVSIGNVRFLAAGVRYVERIIVVADGPMLVSVCDCWRPKYIDLFVVAVVVCVNLAYACLASVVEKPSLQALRAETMVERFTARMHVRWWFWLRRGVWENLFCVRFFDAKVGS